MEEGPGQAPTRVPALHHHELVRGMRALNINSCGLIIEIETAQRHGALWEACKAVSAAERTHAAGRNALRACSSRGVTSSDYRNMHRSAYVGRVKIVRRFAGRHPTMQPLPTICKHTCNQRPPFRTKPGLLRKFPSTSHRPKNTPLQTLMAYWVLRASLKCASTRIRLKLLLPKKDRQLYSLIRNDEGNVHLSSLQGLSLAYVP